MNPVEYLESKSRMVKLEYHENFVNKWSATNYIRLKDDNTATGKSAVSFTCHAETLPEAIADLRIMVEDYLRKNEV